MNRRTTHSTYDFSTTQNTHTHLVDEKHTHTHTVIDEIVAVILLCGAAAENKSCRLCVRKMCIFRRLIDAHERYIRSIEDGENFSK